MEYVFYLVYLAFVVAAFAGLWKVFEKMGRQGWEGIVPIYNIYVLTQIMGRPVIWVVLYCIPCVGLYPWFMLCIDVAKRFGKSDGYGIGLALLGVVFWPMLGFGKDRYLGAPQPQGFPVGMPPQGGPPYNPPPQG